MPRFLALTSRGLLDVLEQELKDLDLKILDRVPGGVWFESNWEGCYRANLELRSCTRVVLPVLDFPAYQADELYHNTLKHDFTKYIDVHQTLAVDATVRDSALRDQRHVALKIKDAVVDQFREKFGERPNVDTDQPSLRIIARVVKDQVSLAIDTSGDSLFLRGYRQRQGVAPLKEHLAAALVKMADWNREITIVDPFCGSGTILIEAALLARHMAPGTLRKRFAFQGFKGFQPEAWQKVVNEVMGQELRGLNFKLYGYDISGKAIKEAAENARRAGVEDDIVFKKLSVAELQPPVEKGVIITNPPYGERLGTIEEATDVYRDLAFTLKTHFKGWDCWLLCGNADLTKELKMKSARKFQLYNGPIECRFIRYEINK